MRQKVSPDVRGSSSPLALLVLCLVAFSLRIAFLDQQSLWGDEAASLSYAQSASLSVLLERVLATDPHPPLYYALLFLWIKVAGTSDFALRWLSLASGLLTVPLAYAFGRRLSRQWQVALLLALFTALSPFLVYYSQEARMYSLAAFLSLLALYALLRAASSGGRWWLVYAAASVAALYALSITIALVVAAASFALLGIFRHWWDAPRRTALGVSGSTLPILAAFLLWQGLQVGQFGQFVAPVPLSQAPLLAVDALKEAVLVNAFGLTLDPSYGATRVYQDISNWEQVYGPPYTTAAAGLVLGLAGWSLLSARREERGGLVWLAVLGLVAVWAVAYLLRLTTFRYAPRLGVIAVPLFLLLSLGLAALPGWALRAVAVFALAAGMVYALWQNYQNPAFSRSEYRTLAEHLFQNLRPEDGVYLHGPPLKLLHKHYLPVPHSVYTVPRDVPVSYGGEELKEQLRQIGARHPRLWLVLGGERDYDPEGLVERWLVDNGYRLENQWFGNSRLSLFAFPGGEAVSAFPSQAVGPELTLMGSTLAGRDYAPGEGLALALTWQVRSPPRQDYRLSLRLKDREGLTWGQRDEELGTHLYPTSSWEGGQPVTVRTGLPIPLGTPPGQYHLEAVVYAGPTGKALERGELGSISVQVSPGPPAGPERLKPPRRANLALGPLRLIGYDVPRKVQPGDRVALRLYWLVQEALKEDHSLAVRLGRGKETLLPPMPTSRWREGEATITQHWLPVPASTAPGRQGLSLSLVSAGGVAAAGPITLTDLEVSQVRRSFAEPRMQGELRAELGGKVELWGFDVGRASFPQTPAPVLTAAPGTSLDMTLYWRAQTEMEASYTVFLQLLDARGRLVAQRDSIPQDGSRPTTGWLPREVIADRHLLALPAGLPAGQYTLISGMYDATTGERLRTLEGDFVSLMSLVITNG